MTKNAESHTPSKEAKRIIDGMHRRASLVIQDFEDHLVLLDGPKKDPAGVVVHRKAEETESVRKVPRRKASA